MVFKNRNPDAHKRVRIQKILKSKDKEGGYPYIRMRVRLRMIFNRFVYVLKLLASVNIIN